MNKQSIMINQLLLDRALLSHKMREHLRLFAIALVVASVVYLLAANFSLLPKIVKLGIAPIFMLLFAWISMYAKNERLVSALQTASGLMIGLQFAVIGQVYQTGADSVWLFLWWSILLLPWLYRANTGICILLLVTGFLSVVLAFEQFLWNDRWVLSAMWLFLIVFAKIFSVQHRWLSWLVILLFIVMSFLAAVDLGFDIYLWMNFPVLLTPFVLFYFYQNKHQNKAAMSLMGGAISLYVWLVVWLSSYTNSFLLLAVLSWVWVGLLIYLLMNFFEKGIFTKLKSPLLVLASYSSVYFVTSWVMLMLSLTLHGSWKLGALSAVSFMLGILAYRQAYRLVFRHLGYALINQGIILADIWLFFLWSQAIEQQIFWLIAMVHLMATWIFWQFKMHRIFIFLHAIMTMIWLFLGGFFGNQSSVFGWAVYALALMPCFLLTNPKLLQHYRLSWRWVAIFSLVMALLTALISTVSILPKDSTEQMMAMIASLPFIVVFGFWLSKMPNGLWLGFMPLGVLMGVGHIEILVVLILIALSLKYQDKLVYALSIAVGISLLWLLYYQLDVVFLVKFAVIFLSGIALFINYLTIDRQLKTQGIV